MILTGVCMENHLNVTGWHELFSPYKSSLFLAAIAIISFEIKPENAFQVLLLFQLKFSKRIIFVFWESWSHDHQLLQKAYSFNFVAA